MKQSLCWHAKAIDTAESLAANASPSFDRLDFRERPRGENFFAGEKENISGCKIVWVRTRLRRGKALNGYLEKRCIPLDLARKHGKEVAFWRSSKLHTVIGFENNSGGFELRNTNFKEGRSPKDNTCVDHGKNHIAVFEGAFNLAFQTTNGLGVYPLTNFLI